MRRTLLYLMAIVYMALGTSLSAEKTTINISTPDGLTEFRDALNSGTYDGQDIVVELKGNISLETVDDWTPIGNLSHPFKGTFNGNNKTISNLTILAANTSFYRGLFGWIEGATINGVILEDVSIAKKASAQGTPWTGALVGSSEKNSTIENCHVLSGTIYESDPTDRQACTGGLMGYFSGGKILLCSNNAKVIKEGIAPEKSLIGGLIGYLTGGTVDRCFNQGIVTGEGAKRTQNIGGLVGEASNSAEITNSYNIGQVTVSETSKKMNTGGIAGTISGSSTITNCYSYADIIGGISEDSYSTGGLVGDVNGGSISNSLCFSNNLTGNENNTHFIAGKLKTGSTLRNNYAWIKGEITDNYGNDLNGELWSGSTFDQPFSDGNWDTEVWHFDSKDASMPALIGFGEEQGILKNLLISTPAQLEAFREAVNNNDNYDGKTVELVADIDLKDVTDWTPIGINNVAFNGTFNGNGHTISNLKISEDNPYYFRGLFGELDGATIKDLILKDVLIEKNNDPVVVPDDNKRIATGALVAFMYNSTIENCHVISGTIYASVLTVDDSEVNTGGLIGYLNNNVENNISLCSNNAKVISDEMSKSSYVGGLIGVSAKGAVDRCFNQGEITTKGATEIQNVGGLVGAAGSNSNIINSYNVGNIVVEADTKVYTGGIAGYTTNMMIAFCYSYADITGGTSANSSTGGIVGFLDNAGIGFSLSLSEKLTGGEGEIGFVCGTLFEESRITEVYSWVKGMNADLYDSGSDNDPNQKNGLLWDGLMDSKPLVSSGDNSEYDWSAEVWNIDATDAFMPKLEDLLEGIVQPNVPNPLKASDATYHTITLEVAAGIDLYGITAGTHQIEEGGHLHLQFLPEATTATAADILFLVDGVETEFTDFGTDKYFSYILNPVSGDHTILIAMKAYTVTLPEVEGVEINVGAGVHTVPYGEKFTFTLTLDDAIDPADVHVFANGIEVEPEALRATVLSYTIDKVITSIVVVIEGTGGTTGNAHIAEGDITLSIINDQLSIINSGSAVDVAVYSITGQNVVSLRGVCGSKTITLKPGIYLVKAGTQTWKVMIKG
ncbi:GLUG motif-containing protein [Parabacteroides sp. PF5-6]|uniref:GLUG motif-containing protein n=1 Tax=Parabacteroides sp. PF5-6 TaxID=1742403 RepID=UPI002406190B|nr:GLUG motif-containing protein [Parabacteroides sp. PF5-6]MDF9831366.1 hypothetical protein [Parabacteroides sp. PF5-6]